MTDETERVDARRNISFAERLAIRSRQTRLDASAEYERFVDEYVKQVTQADEPLLTVEDLEVSIPAGERGIARGVPCEALKRSYNATPERSLTDRLERCAAAGFDGTAISIVLYRDYVEGKAVRDRHVDPCGVFFGQPSASRRGNVGLEDGDRPVVCLRAQEAFRRVLRDLGFATFRVYPFSMYRKERSSHWSIAYDRPGLGRPPVARDWLRGPCGVKLEICWSTTAEPERESSRESIRPFELRFEAESDDSETDDAEDRLSSTSRMPACVVCMVNERAVVLTPCRHLATCSECCRKLRGECPVCREEIVEIMGVFT